VLGLGVGVVEAAGTNPAAAAGAVAFLVSDRVAANITGTTVTIDGGYTTELH